MTPDELVIRHGCRVTLHFSIRLEDGTIAECTEPGEPHRFVLGDGSLVTGLESVLHGLKPGDRERVLLGPDQAFGRTQPDMVHVLRRAELDAVADIEPGMVVGFSTPAGHELAGTVLERDNEHVKVDFNHPLAGHTILFEVEVVGVEPSDD